MRWGCWSLTWPHWMAMMKYLKMDILWSLDQYICKFLATNVDAHKEEEIIVEELFLQKHGTRINLNKKVVIVWKCKCGFVTSQKCLHYSPILCSLVLLWLIMKSSVLWNQENLWHCRHHHLHLPTLDKLSQNQNLVRCLPSIVFECIDIVEGCLYGKFVLKKTSLRISKTKELHYLVHLDGGQVITPK